MKANMVKTLTGWLPADPDTEEWHKKRKQGSVVEFTAKEVRNYKFMKKFFALLRLAFDYWYPRTTSHMTLLEQKFMKDYGPPKKSFNHFRSQLIITAGFSHTVFNLDGSFQVLADSISFAGMEEEAFSKLYNKVLDVIVESITCHADGSKMTAEEMDDLVRKYLHFA